MQFAYARTSRPWCPSVSHVARPNPPMVCAGRLSTSSVTMPSIDRETNLVDDLPLRPSPTLGANRAVSAANNRSCTLVGCARVWRPHNTAMPHLCVPPPPVWQRLHSPASVSGPCLRPTVQCPDRADGLWHAAAHVLRRPMRRPVKVWWHHVGAATPRRRYRARHRVGRTCVWAHGATWWLHVVSSLYRPRCARE